VAIQYISFLSALFWFILLIFISSFVISSFPFLFSFSFVFLPSFFLCFHTGYICFIGSGLFVCFLYIHTRARVCVCVCMHDCVGLSLYAFMQASVCLIYPFAYLIKTPVRTQAYRFFLKYKCVSFFAILSFSLPLNKRFDPTPCWRFLTPQLSIWRSLLWSTTSNVTYAAAMGHQSATSYEPAHRIGVLFT